MEVAIDTQRRRFLARKVRSGQFRSPSEVVNFALGRLEKDERDLAWLEREVKKGLDSLERGDVTPWDLAQAKARLLHRVKHRRRKT